MPANGIFLQEHQSPWMKKSQTAMEHPFLEFCAIEREILNRFADHLPTHFAGTRTPYSVG